MSFSANPPHRGVRCRVACTSASPRCCCRSSYSRPPRSRRRRQTCNREIRSDCRHRRAAPLRGRQRRNAVRPERRRHSLTGTAPQPVEVSAPTAAGDAVVYSPTGVVTPARSTSVTVINSQQIEQQCSLAPDAPSTVPAQRRQTEALAHHSTSCAHQSNTPSLSSTGPT